MSSVESYQTSQGRKWRVRWRDELGKSRQKKSFDTKRQAQLWAADMEVKTARGEFADPGLGKQTLGWYAEQWLKQQAHLKRTSRHLNDQWYRNHIAPRWGERQLGAIRPTDVRSWVAEMEAAEVGVPTITRVFAVFRQILNSAVDDRLITTSPAARVKLPRHQAAERPVLSHVQVAALVAEIGPAYRLVVEILAGTGIRYGELAGLKVSDCDMLRRRLWIRRSVTEVKGELVWSTPKSGRERVVAFPRSLAEPLAAQMEGKSREDLVFTGPAGGVLRNTTFRPRVFNPAVKRCQAADPTFPTIRVHDLRHTAATLAIQAGASVKTLQQMLGHASAVLTLDTYSAYLPDALDSVVDALDQQRREATEQATPGRASGSSRGTS